MIYLSSDLHAGLHWGAFADFTGEKEDTVILLGDTGVFWDESKESKAFLLDLIAKKCRILCVDGNHENFDRLYEIPEEEWNGGKVRRIHDNILYLSRGYIFEIEGKRFFVMGGSASGAKTKAEGIWWEAEYPSEDELWEAYRNLEKAKIDYVLTHTYFLPRHREERDFSKLSPNTLERLFDYIDVNIDFKHWFFGHWHFDRALDEKHTGVFNQLLPLP